MKIGTFIAVLAVALSARNLSAHEIGIGDLFFTLGAGIESVETDALLISIEYAKGYPEDTPHYQVVLKSKVTGIERSVPFQMSGGRMPFLKAFNMGNYCDEKIIFISLLNDPPKYADVLSYLIHTHAFHGESLQYLATAYGPREDIAPLERGVDIGFPYEMPQRYIVECTPATGTQSFEFSLTDRAED
jgi:hypothetical protein